MWTAGGEVEGSAGTREVEAERMEGKGAGGVEVEGGEERRVECLNLDCR